MPTDAETDLLLGTANRGKIDELRVGLAGLPVRIRTLGEFDSLPAPAEDGENYEENALLKARYYTQRLGFLTLADDSGLEVDELQGKPGVLTARFGGANKSDDERLLHLLDTLGDATNRQARFVCVIAIVGARLTEVVRGECYGTIASKPAGSEGFGYDPVFVPEGFTQTFAELSGSIKSLISHRARAIAAAKTKIEAALTGSRG